MQLTCRQQRVSIILLIISFLLLGVSLIITWLNPAVTYEVSIFLSTPKIYWVSLLFSLFIGFFIVIKFNLSDENRIYKNSALLLLFIAYASFLALWIIRGYYLWCPGDPLTHLGWIKDILFLGHTHAHNIYPITHIFLAQISTILNIDPIIPHKYLPILFGLLHVFFMYLFAKSVLPDKLSATIVLLISIIPIHEYYLNLTPNFLSNLLLPLVFFILVTYLKKRNYQWCILLLVMVFLYPAFHPVPSLALLVMIISLTHPVITFVKRTTDKLLFYKEHQINNNGFIVFGILLVVFIITWISSFYVWESTIRNIYTLVAEGGSTHLDTLINDIQYATSYGYSAVLQFFKVYGGRLVYMILMMIGCILLWKKFKQDNNAYRMYQNLFFLIVPTIVFVFLTSLFFLTNVGFNAERIAFYITIISILFVGYVISELLRKRSISNNKLLSLFIPLFLVGLFISAAPLVYPSPYTLESNWQITMTEMTGMDWIMNNKSDASFTSITISQPSRYAEALLTPEERSHAKMDWMIPKELRVPYHFGYDENDSLGEYYSDDIYLVSTNKDKIIYEEVVPGVAHLRFIDNDFIQLDNDNTVLKLYENEYLRSYYIY